MKLHAVLRYVIAFMFMVGTSYAATADATSPTQTILSAYPSLTSGILTHAILDDLPAEQILQSDSLDITEAEMEKMLTEVPQQVREAMRSNLFFLLEQKATRELLLHEALREVNAEEAPANTDALIQGYLARAVGKVGASEEDIVEFYKENQEMFGGASLDQIRDDLRQYVVAQKTQAAVVDYIRSMGLRRTITLSSRWVRQQAALAMDNPADKARASGLPSLIDFGAAGCRPCDMLAPILKNLKTKYAGKMNVEFIDVREQQILAARYGIQSIPVQILFDKGGIEIWRHSGFISQPELEAEIPSLKLE